MNTQVKTTPEAEIARLKQEINSLKRRQNSIGLTYKTETEQGEAQSLLKGNIPFLTHVDEYSVNKNNTEPNHLLIEGDNISSLTLLQETHAGKVDVIYIDPPYNTGNNDFVYNDRYVSSDDGFSHSKWLSFMRPRLELARTLLKDTGVIFVSIDDNEQAYLKVLMDTVFGEQNFVANIVWDGGLKNNSRFVSVGHDYMLVYAKSKSTLIKNNVVWREEKKGLRLFKDFIHDLQSSDENTGEKQKKLRQWLRAQKILDTLDKGLLAYNMVDDDNNVFRIDNISAPSGNGAHYEILHPVTQKPVKQPSRGWAYSEATMKQKIANNEIAFGKDEATVPQVKRVLSDDGANDTQVVRSYFWAERSNANKALQSLLGKNVFNFPKDVNVLKRWISLVSSKNAVVLDFFAGSGTTGQAVAELNKEDGGIRQAILCTNNFEQDGSANGIARDITAERMKRVLTGENWADGKERAPLPGNLQYYRVDFKSKPESDEELVEGVTAAGYAGVVSLSEGTYDTLGVTTLTGVGEAVTRAVEAGEAVVLSSPEKLVLVYGDYEKALWFDEDFENTVSEVKAQATTDGKQFVLYVISDERGYISLDEEQSAFTFPLSYADGVKATVNRLEHQGLLLRDDEETSADEETEA